MGDTVEMRNIVQVQMSDSVEMRHNVPVYLSIGSGRLTVGQIASTMQGPHVGSWVDDASYERGTPVRQFKVPPCR